MFELKVATFSLDASFLRATAATADLVSTSKTLDTVAASGD